MEKNIQLSDNTIQDIIYDIRGVKVMLDYDLAAIYGVETRTLNQAVKRNIERFPPDFMFRLTENEWEKRHLQIILFGRTYCKAIGHKPENCPICSKI